MKKPYNVPEANEEPLRVSNIITASGMITDEEGDSMQDEWGNGK